eukprot:scaffold65929_cov34-Tisochrysis_lutea.AAC.2
MRARHENTTWKTHERVGLELIDRDWEGSNLMKPKRKRKYKSPRSIEHGHVVLSRINKSPQQMLVPRWRMITFGRECLVRGAAVDWDTLHVENNESPGRNRH